MIQYIIGCGSGRSGTGSLTELLSKQKNIWATHEGQFMPWKKDLIAFYQSLIKLEQESPKPIVANIGFYWKNYLSEIFRDLINPKVICLQREREGVIKSFSALYRGKNHWSDPKGKNFDGRNPGLQPLTLMFPTYDLSKEEAIGKYWDEYYYDIDFWLDKFPQNMMLIKMQDAFHTKKAQRKILDFIGIPRKEQVIDLGIWKHKRSDAIKGGMLAEVLHDIKKPEEWDKTARNNRLFGQAAKYAGLKTEYELELTDKEFVEIQDDPEFQRALNAG